MKTGSVTLYTNTYAPNKTVSVKEETRFSSFGDPNGHKVPVHGVSIETRENDIITAETFLAYTGLSDDKEERKGQIAKVVKRMTQVPEEHKTANNSYFDSNYVCGRDSHEAYLY